MKKITILGSTGSIGRQALDIIRKNKDKFAVSGLTCRSRIDLLIEQIREFSPSAVCVGNGEYAEQLQKIFPKLEVCFGEKGLLDISSMNCDIVLNALMGISGLAPTYKAITSGNDVALANKETLVTGGKIIMDSVSRNNIRLLPVDSEHSAIFQCLEGNKGRNIKRLILTASGGPFRNSTYADLRDVTAEQALKHPKWNMGNKITIDSATMMNKGLEVIEAKWLFNVPEDNIEIHIHPESIIHSMVEFEDTSIIAQLGIPDMRIPISFSLGYPERISTEEKGLDLLTTGRSLTFEKPNRKIFRCIDIAYSVLKLGGSAPVYINGANEELVELFLSGKIKFLDIQNSLLLLLESHKLTQPKSIDEILDIDAEARIKVHELLNQN